MARRKLRSPDQPLPLQALLWLFEFFASLKLAVVLIFSCAAALSWATFVESEYGTPAVQFGVYGSRWFELLNALLAISIFCAAAIRFPWKKHQTGFVITHIGLLVLLFGCLQQRRGGIDAQMPVFEDGIGYRVYTDAHLFQLTVHPAGRTGGELEVIEIPFEPGPFNWQDYATLFLPMKISEEEASRLGWAGFLPSRTALAMKNLFRVSSGVAFRMVARDQGILYERDGIKLEALDFYADSQQVDAPLVRLKMSMPAAERMGPDGKLRPGKVSWMPVKLELLPRFPLDFPNGMGSGRPMGGGRITFNLAASEAERDAFLASRPRGALGTSGQVVLYAAGRPHRFAIDQLKEKQQAGEKLALGDSGLHVELVRWLADGALTGSTESRPLEVAEASEHGWPEGPVAHLGVYRGDKEVDRLVLFSDYPEASIQAHQAGVFGSYWFDHGEKTTAELMGGKGGARIDVIQGPDEKLYYRLWNRKEVAALAELPGDGTKVDAFKMPIAQLEMYVDEFVPSPRLTKVELPLPFDGKKVVTSKRRAAKLRLTVDGKESEFWLAGIPIEPFERPPLPGERRIVAGSDRTVSITMPPRDVFQDVGFQVRLKKFHRKLDPGTSQPSHYGSTIDVMERTKETAGKGGRTLWGDVEISMNAPVDFADPKSGRTYRLFQESFGGPWGPDDPIYLQHAKKDQGREQFFMSVLTVNYDPGRGAKMWGCLLIVAGIFTMFYMRAYFFKPKARSNNDAAA